MQGVRHDVTASASFGDFYRPLAPGNWLITASLPGYGNASVPVTVPRDGSGVMLDFQLAALDESGRPVNSLRVRINGVVSENFTPGKNWRGILQADTNRASGGIVICTRTS